MKYPKLFKGQKAITQIRLDELEQDGFIVPKKSLHDGVNRSAEISNPTAGNVVGYTYLAEKYKRDEITQNVARDLLSIEAARNGGPRMSHVTCLVKKAFAEDKRGLLWKIEEWAQKQK